MSVRILQSRPARNANLELLSDVKYFAFSGKSTDEKPTSVKDGKIVYGICN